MHAINIESIRNYLTSIYMLTIVSSEQAKEVLSLNEMQDQDAFSCLVSNSHFHVNTDLNYRCQHSTSLSREPWQCEASCMRAQSRGLDMSYALYNKARSGEWKVYIYALPCHHLAHPSLIIPFGVPYAAQLTCCLSRP